MKKALPLVLSIIMLTACTPAPPPTPPEPTPTPLIEVQLQWETPDEGFSAIPAGEEPKYYYEKPLDSFIPSEEYGRIYPYLGSGEMVEWEAVYQYGLCTENGEIITAPIYSAPQMLGFGDKRAYLLCTVNDMIVGMSRHHEGPTSGILVGLDGSWVEYFEDMAFLYAPYMFGGSLIDGPVVAIEREGLWGGLSTADGSASIPFRHDSSDAVYDAAYGLYFPADALEEYDRPITYDRLLRRLKGNTLPMEYQLLDRQGKFVLEYRGGIYGVGNDFFLIRDSDWGRDDDGFFGKLLWETLETYDKDGQLLAHLDLELPEESGDEEEVMRPEYHASGDYVMVLRHDESIVYDSYFNELFRFTPDGVWRSYGTFIYDDANESVQFHSEAIYISDANTGLHRTYRPDGTLLTTCYFGGE